MNSEQYYEKHKCKGLPYEGLEYKNPDFPKKGVRKDQRMKTVQNWQRRREISHEGNLNISLLIR